MPFYCAFHKHANSKVQKPPLQLHFSLLSIIITTTSNEPWNTETHKTDRNPPITNHKPWPFEPVKVKFCFLRGRLRWLTAAKNAIVSWLLNIRIRMVVKSAVTFLKILLSGFPIFQCPPRLPFPFLLHKMHDRLCKVQCKTEHWILAEMERHTAWTRWPETLWPRGINKLEGHAGCWRYHSWKECEYLIFTLEGVCSPESLKKQYVFFLFKKKHEHLEHRASLFVLSLLTRNY